MLKKKVKNRIVIKGTDEVKVMYTNIDEREKT